MAPASDRKSREAPRTRSRAYRKNDNAYCEQKNWTHVRQIFGHERFEQPELVPLMNDLYAQEWSQYTNHFKPTFKLLRREKKARLRAEHASPDPSPSGKKQNKNEQTAAWCGGPG